MKSEPDSSRRQRGGKGAPSTTAAAVLSPLLFWLLVFLTMPKTMPAASLEGRSSWHPTSSLSSAFMALPPRAPSSSPSYRPPAERYARRQQHQQQQCEGAGPGLATTSSSMRAQQGEAEAGQSTVQHASSRSGHDRSRRAALYNGGGMVAAAALAVACWQPGAAQALVKGNAPPPDLKKRVGKGGSTAGNMEEARERGRKKEDELFSDSEDGSSSSGSGSTGSGFQVTPQGDRYKDMKQGDGQVVKEGDAIDIRYKALRLGKRSRDGLSGEATTVFSFGYGEDDDKEGDTMPVTLGTSNVIPALASALLGMRVGGKRRVLVRPERGWFRGGGGGGGGCGEALDGMNMNSLAASFIVPGTRITEAEDCLDLTRIPAPSSYAARRRMGRRFDESLIVEVEVVKQQQQQQQ